MSYENFFRELSGLDVSHKIKSRSKVTVVGVGQVGMAAAFSVLNRSLCGEIALVDVVADKLKGEMLDLQHGQQFSRPCVIKADTDYSVSAGSNVVVITAGARQREGESRLNLVQRNVEIFKGIIPQIAKHSPNAILVIVSNPVDILTHVAWKLSGFPKNRVIGSGTMLDSARFRHLIADRLNICTSSVHGYILGEHGDSSVPVWSGVNIGAVNLQKVNPLVGKDTDPMKFNNIHKEVIQSAYEVIHLKGYTSWAIGMTISTLVEILLRDHNAIYPLTTCVKGFYGIEEDVFLSLPCVVSSEGITRVVVHDLALSSEEVDKLRQSAATLNNIIQSIQW